MENKINMRNKIKMTEIKSRILVIDGDELLGECICSSLSNHNYDVYLATDELNALSFSRKERFDLIILDFDLPDNSGEKILKKMRSKGVAAPIIVMDRYNDPYGIVKIINIGGDDCISKPFDLDELCERVNAVKKHILHS